MRLNGTWSGRVAPAPASRSAPCPGASFCGRRRQRRVGRHAQHPAERPKHPSGSRCCGGEGSGHVRLGQQVPQLSAIARRLRHQPDQPGKPRGQPLAGGTRPGQTRPAQTRLGQTGFGGTGAWPRRRPGPPGEGGETPFQPVQAAPGQLEQGRQGRKRRHLLRHRPAQRRHDRGEAAGQRGEGERRGHEQTLVFLTLPWQAPQFGG